MYMVNSYVLCKHRVLLHSLKKLSCVNCAYEVGIDIRQAVGGNM